MLTMMLEILIGFLRRLPSPSLHPPPPPLEPEKEKEGNGGKWREMEILIE